jgi:hypothetical protein
MRATCRCTLYLKTAEALGLTSSQMQLLADEVVE